ncbi:putative alanine transaminase [Helianthus annuus]|nr:putative alanine transaminase [Helianthus annuus]
MYLFPRIQLPIKAIKEAESLKKTPDAYYAACLLNATGIVWFWFWSGSWDVAFSVHDIATRGEDSGCSFVVD